MTISYTWLSDYLPIRVAPEKLSEILTAIGLEVEAMETYEDVRGGLKGLVIGEVLKAEPHPNADKLRLTAVNVGNGEPLQIVCGAPNVAAGQKVIVAPVGTTIYPTGGEPLTMKVAKIRGTESYGMICAEDEVGLGTSHAGIMVLSDNAPVGTPAADYLKPYSDTVFEIGLTPNRADAMSHWGVARDVCAYLSHHENKTITPSLPKVDFSIDNHSLPIDVVVENNKDCPRYSGVCLSGLTVKPSPKWLQDRLKSIGQRPINNIVDITNFIQHETGQPLHAFDYDKIRGKKIVVKNLPEATPFVTLDEKERKLSNADLMICDAQEGMCIAGVFGGQHSGVSEDTKNIFLESAFFDPATIRKTSFRHGLRTDAATRFEKGIDISNTVNVLKRAAVLIKETAGGTVASDIIDIYPAAPARPEVRLTYAYLKTLSGKQYPSADVKTILQNLGFTIRREDAEALVVEVPYHKRDVSLPADIVEEIVRIDGLDNIEIPTAITLTPSVEQQYANEAWREKASASLAGAGFSEILTNSITNSKHFNGNESAGTVKLLNNLSTELDVLRPTMLPTALETIAFNRNRKNGNLKLFEWGKTYRTNGSGHYEETSHLCLYLTGNVNEQSWNSPEKKADVFYLKGIAESLLRFANLDAVFTADNNYVTATIQGEKIMELGEVPSTMLNTFDLKEPVYFAVFWWDAFLKHAASQKIQYREVPKFPAVERDLAMTVPKTLPYNDVRSRISGLRLQPLKAVQLFDVFESEKIGQDKKSLAVRFTFLNEEKTLTDKEIDGWMSRIVSSLEKELGAEIRK